MNKEQKEQDTESVLHHKLDQMSTTLQAMQEIMQKNGLLGQKKDSGIRQGNVINPEVPCTSNSETTIYHNVVEKRLPEEDGY